MEVQYRHEEFLDAEADGYVAGVMFGRWASEALGDDRGDLIADTLLRRYPDAGSAPASLIAFLRGVRQGTLDQHDEDELPFRVEFHRFVDVDTLERRPHDRL